jgi:putative ABC transport system ATP-binding protein
LDIVLSDVVKTYRTGDGAALRALDGVSVSISAGDAVAVVGASGSGKSTMLHVIGSMDTPDEGTVQVGDQSVSALREREQSAYRRRIGFIFQRFHLLPALSVLDNVCAPVLPYKTDFDRRERAHELLSAVGMADRKADLPARLSGGQQQRVAIARALINRPGLLLADEPTGSLDSRTGKDVIDLLLRLRAEYGLTLLIATHDNALAQRCDRRIRLVDGRITEDDRNGGADDGGEAVPAARRGQS